MRRAVAAAVVLVAGTAAAYGPGTQPAPVQTPVPPAPAASSDPVADFEQMLRELDQREKRLGTELAAIGPELDTCRRRMVARGRSYYRLVRAGLLPVGGGFDALVEHATTVERLRAALARDLALVSELGARQTEITAELRRLRAERAPLLIQREAMQRARSAMQQADERNAAFLRAFGSTDVSPHVAIYGTSRGTDEPLARFRDLRGRLALPLPGRAEVVEPPAPGKRHGIYLRASRDTDVRAVYPGRVVFVGRSEHGETVVIDHGDRYFTVYGNLGHVEARDGEQVTEHGRIGWILRYAGQSPILYFELRRGDEPLDAAQWLGL
jgi:murein DD-endopeptidase MepM/ murein hydrolase activator NlpD